MDIVGWARKEIGRKRAARRIEARFHGFIL
jgi:hypothetical protein